MCCIYLVDELLHVQPLLNLYKILLTKVCFYRCEATLTTYFREEENKRPETANTLPKAVCKDFADDSLVVHACLHMEKKEKMSSSWRLQPPNRSHLDPQEQEVR